MGCGDGFPGLTNLHLGSFPSTTVKGDDVDDIGSFALDVGRALRRARHARGLTLRQLSAVSKDRFKPTSVAGYERGERTISLERFCELCRLYEVPPQVLLAEILRPGDGTSEPDVDLALLEYLGPAESTLVAGFIRQIRSLRGDVTSGRIALRSGDLEVLTTAAGKRPDELQEALEERLRSER